MLSLAACGGGSGGGSPTEFTLSVQKGGTGAGTVTGGGISCGATCSASLSSGTPVTLTASAAAGSTFVGWSGCDTAAGATCDVTMNAGRTVTATFDTIPGQGSLHVVNGSGYTITELYASPAGAGTWGADRLATQIDPAGTFDLTGVAAGSYDFRAVAFDGISYWQKSSVTIIADGVFTWTLAPPDVGALSVVNHHCVALTELRVRPSSSPAWSQNQLAAPLDPAGTFTLTPIPVGVYDVSAVATDGSTWTTDGIAITAGGTFTWPLYMPAGTGCLTVVNNTADTIDVLFDPLSPAGCTGNNWGTERLMGTTIAAGSSFTLSDVLPGAHDLRALGVSPLQDPVEYRLCGMGIPAGGTFTWYLVFPP